MGISTTAPAPLLRTSAISAHDMTVLIVDDDPIITETIKHLLKRMDVGSRCASQWAEAIDALEHAPPDLVLLDVRMPNVDGPTLLEFIRESGNDVPVVIVSGSLNEVDLGRLRELGVIRFVPKPFSVEQLRGIIEDQLQLNKPPSEIPNDRAKESQSEVHSPKAAVSSPRSVLGRRWGLNSGVRRKRKKQFWMVATICAGLSIAVVGATLMITETNIF